MALSMLKSKRGTKVLDDKKHVKTIPTKYAPVFEKVNSKMTFEKKRLNPDERKNLEIQLQFKKYLAKIAISEPAIFSYIKETHPVDKLIAINPDGKKVVELQLSNGVKIVCPSIKMGNLFPDKEPYFRKY